ncbi:hypothetical protein chiPu_0026021, partial [Chiloscyllium punctatum]|nr:hypothetical protein [Chiloscyllium punctatum]
MERVQGSRGGGSAPRGAEETLRAVSPANCFICSECGMTFDLYSRLESHMVVHRPRNHVDRSSFRCPVCGRSFSQPGSLRRHAVTHTVPYQCHKDFGQHGEEWPLRCGVCDRDFRHTLGIHRLFHAAEWKRREYE